MSDQQIQEAIAVTMAGIKKTNLPEVEDAVIHVLIQHQVFYSEVDTIMTNVKEKLAHSIITNESFEIFNKN